MAKRNSTLSAKTVRRFLDYNPDTGEFFWKHREKRYFGTPAAYHRWNRKFAGKKTGYVDARGYVRIGVYGKLRYAHQLAWIHTHGSIDSETIDHINGNPSDNRISNLRAASEAENIRNSRVGSNNRSGYKNVSSQGEKWCVKIQKDGKVYRFGPFSEIEEAARVAAERRVKLHGEFANHG